MRKAALAILAFLVPLVPAPAGMAGELVQTGYIGNSLDRRHG